MLVVFIVVPSPSVPVLFCLHVGWALLSPFLNGCMCLLNRATVVEDRDTWYMDDEQLSRLLCEDVQDNDDKQPEVVNSCCACDEAKYEVTCNSVSKWNCNQSSSASVGRIVSKDSEFDASHYH